MAPCDVYVVYVIMKQLYLSEEHERALKARDVEPPLAPVNLVGVDLGLKDLLPKEE
jgi:hypothetical protein